MPSASRADLPPALAAIRRHVFLSPHYDDIALSTGATVSLLADHGFTPETLVVFGSEPDRSQPLTAFAESLHRGWGLTADEVIARRRAEEETAATVLGSCSSVLPFRDAIYRGALYLSDDDLFGTPAPAERSLPAAIVASLSLSDSVDAGTRFYAPLGVGRHVDHQLVCRAGLELAAQGWDVWFYEDVPYALNPGALEARLADIAKTTRLEPAGSVPAQPGWERKIAAVLSYPSQLETVFQQYVGVGTSRDEIDSALWAYATRAGEHDAVERFWRAAEAANRSGS
jgi:LmbE family N-acetylglucosaminyl deacetylase